MPFPQAHSKLLKYWRGFTLAELLISLAILGVIATFTIPKILVAQQDSSYKSKAKEVVAMVSAAYQQYRASNTVSNSFNIQDLTPYLNYVSYKTSGLVDTFPAEGTVNCAFTKCLKLHNGGVIRYDIVSSMAGTSSTNAVFFDFDPSGTADTTSGVTFWLYYNGSIKNYGNIIPNTINTYSGVPYPKFPNPAFDPPWFSW